MNMNHKVNLFSKIIRLHTIALSLRPNNPTTNKQNLFSLSINRAQLLLKIGNTASPRPSNSAEIRAPQRLRREKVSCKQASWSNQRGFQAIVHWAIVEEWG